MAGMILMVLIGGNCCDMSHYLQHNATHAMGGKTFLIILHNMLIQMNMNTVKKVSI